MSMSRILTKLLCSIPPKFDRIISDRTVIMLFMYCYTQFSYIVCNEFVYIVSACVCLCPYNIFILSFVSVCDLLCLSLSE